MWGVELKGSREERGMEERRGRWAVGEKRGRWERRERERERTSQEPIYERKEVTASGSIAKPGKIQEAAG